MKNIEIHVPDIGDFSDVPVAEIFVSVGDIVAEEEALVSVESDKATMDIPSPVAGKITELKVSVGDMVSKGALLCVIEVAAEQGAAPAAPTKAAAAPSVQQQSIVSEDAYDVAVIGGGPGGYSAAFRAADLGQRVALIERYATLGGVCLNVGCIPSKALLHVAAVREEAAAMADHGVTFGDPSIDIEKLRGFKTQTIRKMTDGLGQMARMRKVDIIQGVATFRDANNIAVDAEDGATRTVSFKNAIIAAGSSAIKLPFLPDDPRIVTSTGALELPQIPKNLLVIGGGIIGLEMATVYSALGARVDVVEQADGLLAGVDRDLVKIWTKQNSHRFDRIMLNTRITGVEATDDGLHAVFDGADAEPKTYDLILQSAGRRPNGGTLSLDAAGVAGDNGFVTVNDQMRTNIPHIFAIGDIVGQPMLAHKAVHEAHVAAEVIAGENSSFDPMVIPSVAYVSPEIAWVGLTEDKAKETGADVKTARFPWVASGRAVANGAEYGMTKLVFDKKSDRIVGGAIIGPNAGDMIGEICLAIEMGADAIDIGKTIHPHPTLGETIGLAAEVAHGSCTDLPPARK